MNTIKEYLSLSEFEAVIFGNNKIEISDAVLRRVKRSFNFLNEFSRNKVIYGVNTGFGPMAQYRPDSTANAVLRVTDTYLHPAFMNHPFNCAANHYTRGI